MGIREALFAKGGRCVSVFLLALTCLSGPQAWAWDEEDVHEEMAEGVLWTFVVENGQSKIINWYSRGWGQTVDVDYRSRLTSAVITVPSTLGGCPVVSMNVGSGPFPNVKTLQLPDTIGSGNSANGFTSLTTLISSKLSLFGSYILTKDLKTLAGCLNNLTEARTPSGITRIETSAFSCNDILKTLIVSEGVEEIGDEAFCNCGSLTTVTFPTTLEFIDDWAFDYCERLRSVYYCSKLPPACGREVYYAASESLVSYVPWTPSTDTWMDRGWANWTPPKDGSGKGPSPTPGPTPGPTPPEPEPEPGEEGFDEPHTFNGLVYVDDMMWGIIQVTTGKETAKGVKVGGFVILTDGKKQTIKSVTETNVGGKLYVETTASKLGDVELTITGSGFTGSVGLMTVKSGAVGEDTGIVSGTLKMSYFDAKTNKLKTRSIKLGGVASEGEAAGTLETKGEDTKTFSAAIE